MKVWTIANQKGGVGKTTSTVTLAGLLAQKGYKILLIDMDPHGSLTSYFGWAFLIFLNILVFKTRIGKAMRATAQDKVMSALVGINSNRIISLTFAIGAGLARTTCEVTLFADTEREIATAPEENFTATIPSNYTQQDAIATALDLLRRKAIARGANPDHLELEVVEAMAFNMVRGFYTTGQNIRVMAQVKPGLIHGYGPIVEKIDEGP